MVEFPDELSNDELERVSKQHCRFCNLDDVGQHGFPSGFYKCHGHTVPACLLLPVEGDARAYHALLIKLRDELKPENME